MPPQQGTLLQDIGTFRPPMFGGTQPLPYQTFNAGNAMGGGPMGQAAGMFMQPMIAQMMQQQGMVPGQFQPTMNVIDHMKAQQFFQEQQVAMREAAQADTNRQRQALQGFFNVPGMGKGPEQQKFIDYSVGKLQQAAPIMASLLPGMWDRVHGITGSAEGFTQNMMLGARYQTDPITGQMGMSGTSAGQLGRSVFKELYGQGADVSRMRGIGGAEAGALYGEMATRGMIGGRSRGEILQGMQQEGGFKSQQEMTERYGGQGSPEMQQRMRTFDAKRTAQQVQGMAGALAAMKEIYGEAGDPNAPLPKLMNGLEALTKSGMATMSGDKMEGIVRRISETARSTGLGMDNMIRLHARGGQLAQAAGMDAEFGIEASNQAANFGRAFATAGQPGVKAYGRLNAEQMTAMDQQLRVNARKSGLGNLLGAAQRMVSEGLVTPGSDLEKMNQAVRAGRETFVDAGGKTVNIADLANNPQGFLDIAARSGVDQNLANQMFMGTAANLEAGRDKSTNVENFARRGQARLDFDPIVRSAAGTAVSGMLGTKGFVGAQLEAMVPKLTDTVASALKNMKIEDRANPRKRNEIIMKALRSQMSDAEFKQLGTNDAERNRALAQIGSTTTSNIDEHLKNDPRVVPRHHLALFDAMDENIMAEQAKLEAQDEFNVQMKSATAGLGQGGPTRRLFEAIINTTDKTGLADIMMQTMGGVSRKALGERLGPIADQLKAEQAKLKAMAMGEGDYGGMEATERQRMLADQNKKVQGLVGEFRTEAEKRFGTADPDAAKAMRDSAKGGDGWFADADWTVEQTAGGAAGAAAAGGAAGAGAGGGGGKGGGGRASIEITGTLIVKPDGQGDLVNATAQRGSAPGTIEERVMEIFSNQAGFVTAIEGDVTPLLLEIGDDPEDEEPNANWGGFDEFRAIITGFGVQQQGGFQFLHTLRDFIYVYVFGERVGQLTIEGLAFNTSCDHEPDVDDPDDPDFGSQYHGLEWVHAYYLQNRITVRPDPIAIVLGLDTPLLGFLTALKFNIVDQPNTPFMGQFAMAFHIIPDAGDLVGEIDDDFDTGEVLKTRDLFADQLQFEAGAGLPGGNTPPPPAPAPPPPFIPSPPSGSLGGSG